MPSGSSSAGAGGGLRCRSTARAVGATVSGVSMPMQAQRSSVRRRGRPEGVAVDLTRITVPAPSPRPPRGPAWTTVTRTARTATAAARVHPSHRPAGAGARLASGVERRGVALDGGHGTSRSRTTVARRRAMGASRCWQSRATRAQRRSRMVPVPRPPPQHMVTRPVAPPVRSQLVHGLGEQDGAGAAERVAEGDGAAVGVDPVEVGAELLGPRQHDRGERLVDLEDVDVVDAEAVAVEQVPGGVDGAGEHQHGIDADEAGVDDAGQGREAELGGLLGGHDQHGGGAVGDLRGGAGGVDAVLAEPRA